MTTPKDGTTKKRKGVKAVTRWAIQFPDGKLGHVFYETRQFAAQGLHNMDPLQNTGRLIRFTFHLPATGIIKKARK